MKQFENIREQHFKNIPYTPKQIIDVYNSVYGTSKSEQNLVFVETKLIFLPTSNVLNLSSTNELGFLHYGMPTHNSTVLLGFPLTAIEYRPVTYNLENMFFSIIDQRDREGFYLYTRFRVA